jgi:hypothetical protein
MKKSYLTIVLTLTSLLGFGISAHAQDASGVTVKVPFEFIAGGRVMPAGTYSINRVSSDARSGLIIHSYGNSGVLLPMAIDDAVAGKAQFTFEHVGDRYFLSKVDTPAGIYTIETPRAITRLAQSMDHGTQSSSGN